MPEPGGIYAQHPVLMERFYYIMSERSKVEEAEAEKNKPKGKPRARNR